MLCAYLGVECQILLNHLEWYLISVDQWLVFPTDQGDVQVVLLERTLSFSCNSFLIHFQFLQYLLLSLCLIVLLVVLEGSSF